MITPIYLDYNATTPHDPEVTAAIRPYLDRDFGNPSSMHWYGIKPKQAVDRARSQVAQLLNCTAEEIIFTSGGTEANNHALKGIAFSMQDKGDHIITTQIEHPAVLEVCNFLQEFGFHIIYLPVDSNGIVNPTEVKKAIKPNTILISVMHANNEVGSIEPVGEIAQYAKEQGIVMHTDAAQSVGKIPTDIQNLNVDLLSIAGHKLYAPKGVGVLFKRKSLQLKKFMHGAGQEMGARAGTENVMEIVGLGKACDIAYQNLHDNMENMRFLRDRLYQHLSSIDGVKRNGDTKECLPNTLSLSFYGINANRLLEEIGLHVAVSAGAACHSEEIQISHVLKAMQIPQEWAKGTIRFSIGKMTTVEEIDIAARIVTEAVDTLRKEQQK